MKHLRIFLETWMNIYGTVHESHLMYFAFRICQIWQDQCMSACCFFKCFHADWLQIPRCFCRFVFAQVRVADAQGLRLMSGGEIRLVITLCAWAPSTIFERFSKAKGFKGFKGSKSKVMKKAHTQRGTVELSRLWKKCQDSKIEKRIRKTECTRSIEKQLLLWRFAESLERAPGLGRPAGRSVRRQGDAMARRSRRWGAVEAAVMANLQRMAHGSQILCNNWSLSISLNLLETCDDMSICPVLPGSTMESPRSGLRGAHGAVFWGRSKVHVICICCIERVETKQKNVHVIYKLQVLHVFSHFCILDLRVQTLNALQPNKKL